MTTSGSIRHVHEENSNQPVGRRQPEKAGLAGQPGTPLNRLIEQRNDNENGDSMIDRIRDYRHKLVVLRQIMSNKARSYGRTNTWMKIATVLVSSLLTFMGFTGTTRLTTYISWVTAVTAEQVEFIFNTAVFAMFVIVIFHLVFRFSERESEASRAIVMLTHLKNSIDDLLLRVERGYQPTETDAGLVAQKYEMLIEVLPPNSESEYRRALREIPNKQIAKLPLQLSAHDLFDSKRQEAVLRAVILKSETIMQLLETIRMADDRLYLGGGVVRNAVWDYLHAYPSITAPEDVDVIYFDPKNTDKVHDESIERKLRDTVPNVRWSVKNQARMHIVNKEVAYSSLEDAVSKWPETATAMVIRKSQGGALEVIAPCGLDDLFRLVVRPTPHFSSKLDRYRERLEKKKWESNWPKLSFFDREQKAQEAALPSSAGTQRD